MSRGVATVLEISEKVLPLRHNITSMNFVASIVLEMIPDIQYVSE